MLGSVRLEARLLDGMNILNRIQRYPLMFDIRVSPEFEKHVKKALPPARISAAEPTAQALKEPPPDDAQSYQSEARSRPQADCAGVR